MADDSAILRQFQMRSSLRTYLTVVICRLFLDERIARFGKWRPSRKAVRVGSTAVLFERLTMRDGLIFEDPRHARIRRFASLDHLKAIHLSCGHWQTHRSPAEHDIE